MTAMRRRDLLTLALAGTGVLATAATAEPPGCPADGTPMQFVPRKPADPNPTEDDLRKYPSCPYCGMDRRQFHHSRMLVHYSDDLPDATCSLHCAAISLALNIDRGPKAIYVADTAATADVKPLVEVGQANFLVGSSLKGVMTRRSKVAYGSEAAAKASQTANGGDLADFDRALLAAYADMAGDVAMIRKNREERRKRMQQPKHG
ncbi:MAG TPA: nitrous oxide reductase accessory protein NosL [Candidatus Methylomirabilis sp.]|nr:nitrous oxide reductase accessory protein NosL [Candidatus Methylomirabilis sp.]